MQQPDVEVYIKTNDLDAIESWLQSQFEQWQKTSERPKHLQFSGAYNGEPIPVHLMEKTPSKAFTCLWIDSAHSPWQDDRSLAQQLFAALQKEVRFTLGSWASEQEPDAWQAINDQGETSITWHTD